MNFLSGIKVVDMTAFLAAPTVARILGEWGADVIKVEAPKGDPGRTQGAVFGTPYTDDENLGFDMSNMNKRFVTLDLRQEAGREVMDRLLADADVFLTSTRVKSLVKLGYDFETLHERFPRLVMAQVLGFGAKGPLKDAAGFDMTACMSRGGVLGTTVNRGSSPMIPPNGYGDFQVSFVLASGILAALLGRERSGQGDYVTTSLFHSGVFMLNTAMVAAQYGSAYPKDRREVINPFNNTYVARDGLIMTLCAPEYDHDFDKVMTLLGREDLTGDTRYNICDTINDQGLNGEVVDILDAAFATRDRQYWLDLFLSNDIPIEACQLPTDV
ncbi:CaiB/BaiF CoA transferase family protein [Actinomyces timonensis]|uniref:CaiB/BaiF CoA transferase family protein n=1 Tax=Actinomyces timonensis TaxID=1288391 RepID=UPI0002FA1926|nr:CoA transferase [Actinomyces timonensis]